MDPRTVQFFVFIAFNAACLAAGYGARRAGWLHENHSRRIHLFTVVVLWPIVGLLSVWSLHLEARNLWILVIPPLQVAIGAYVAIPVCRLFGLSRNHTGVVAIAAALANQGFTMGAYLAYCLLDPAEQALAYGIGFVTIMQVATVPLVYPLARRFGPQEPDDQPLWKLIVGSFIDLRAMPMYAAGLGLILAMMSVPKGPVFGSSVFLNVVIYLGALGAMFGIGMRLRLGDTRRYLVEHAALTLMRFVILPAATFCILALIELTPLGISTLLRDVAIIEAFAPAALMTVMIANIFHLDTRLASSAWFWNTVFFLLVPLPVLLWWFG